MWSTINHTRARERVCGAYRSLSFLCSQLIEPQRQITWNDLFYVRLQRKYLLSMNVFKSFFKKRLSGFTKSQRCWKDTITSADFPQKSIQAKVLIKGGICSKQLYLNLSNPALRFSRRTIDSAGPHDTAVDLVKFFLHWLKCKVQRTQLSGPHTRSISRARYLQSMGLQSKFCSEVSNVSDFRQ